MPRKKQKQKGDRSAETTDSDNMLATTNKEKGPAKPAGVEEDSVLAAINKKMPGTYRSGNAPVGKMYPELPKEPDENVVYNRRGEPIGQTQSRGRTDLLYQL